MSSKLKQTSQKLPSLAQSLAEVGVTLQKLAESQKKTDEKLKEVSDLVGGISNNLGTVTEEYFIEGLSEAKQLGELHFDEVIDRMRGKKGEYDIVLENDKTVGIVEVKHKLHPNDVEKLVRYTLPAFKEDFPQYKDYQLVGAVASMGIPKVIQAQAIKAGLFVLTQSGKTMKVEAPKVVKTY